MTSDIFVFGVTRGTASPVCIRLSTRARRLPSLPPGWRSAKSSSLKPRFSARVTAKASPSANIVVVEAVGASPSEQASLAMEQSNETSAADASVEISRFVLLVSSQVMLISGTCRRLMVASRRRISSVSPLAERARTTSPRTTMPRSPWTASTGCRYRAGVPVELSVAAIFLAMIPLLPMPVTTTRPRQLNIRSTA